MASLRVESNLQIFGWSGTEDSYVSYSDFGGLQNFHPFVIEAVLLHLLLSGFYSFSNRVYATQ